MKYMSESGSPLIMPEDIEKAEKNLKIARSQQPINNAKKKGDMIMTSVFMALFLVGVIIYFIQLFIKILLLRL